jgi:hypothetical protein
VKWLRESPCGRIAEVLTNEGFSWDYISDDQLQNSTVDGGAIVSPGGTRYRAVVIPATRRMPVETLSQLLALQQKGGAVIYEAAPEDVPGLGRLEERRKQFRDLRQGIALSGSVVGNIVENLVQRGAAREPLVETGLRFIRRVDDEEHAYFLVNLTDRPVEQWVTLGRLCSIARFHDPHSGRGGVAAWRADSAGRPQVFLQLAPGESLLLHTSEVAPRSFEPHTWPYARTTGQAAPLTGEWSLVLGQRTNPGRPPAWRFSELKSWTELDSETAQNFAGTGRYRIEFKKPAGNAEDWLLELGDVRESARVRVNGVEVATLWSVPFRLRIGAHLKEGTNVLEIEVTNLAANRIRDLDRRGVEWRIMREINFVNINYRPFDASQWPLTPSGLLGPVTLTPLKSFDPQTTR